VSWLSTLKFLTEPDQLNTVQLAEERRPIEPAAVSKNVSNKDIEVYFTPGFLPQEIITAHMEAAKETLDIAIYSWTLPSLAAAAINAHKRGVVVRVVEDYEQGKADYSVTEQLVDGGVNVVLDEQSGLMHNKFMVIDDKVVLTGSYNWTRAATSRNRENFLVIAQDRIVQAYKENFEEIWRNNQILKR